MLKQILFINGKLIEQREIKGFFSRGEYWPGLSRVWVCPKCGDAWAKAVVLADEKVRPFQVYSHPCEQCDALTYMDPPGSIYLSYDKDFLETLGEAALRREFLLHADYVQKMGYI